MNERRVVITGIGVVAPGGVGTAEFWERLLSGKSAIRRISLFDAARYRSRIAGEVDFDPGMAGLTNDEAAGMDRGVQLALACLKEALADSGADDSVPAERIGVSIGTAVGNTIALEEGYVAVSDSGANWVVDPDLAPPWMYQALVPSTVAAQTAVRAGAGGPVRTISTGCTSGLDAVIHGAELIRDGMCDRVIAGATEAPISPITVACFDAIRATSPDNDAPETASRPFHKSRNGFVLAEGAAILILEEESVARRRGARIYAEVSGFAQRANAFHMTGLKPDGAEMADAIHSALTMGRMNAEDIHYVNAHGSGTRQNDRHESAAFKESLGAHAFEVPVSSIKSVVGHSLGAIGAIEVVASVLAMEHDIVPPTANLDEVDPQLDLDYVPLTAREHRTDAVLTVGSGFGGFQTAMVLAQPSGSRR